ncbi:hypothetical protein B0H16DRAFT_378418 [Mycena metata]|uniref:Uncharacterized protein n=1 Tax=Mycena metata TaxID=1033252 RepID=A0AAD7HI61_9AGAR|nr:hypothetical protein B0H16DRAFT_378418 [Mycena metata]
MHLKPNKSWTWSLNYQNSSFLLLATFIQCQHDASDIHCPQTPLSASSSLHSARRLPRPLLLPRWRLRRAAFDADCFQTRCGAAYGNRDHDGVGHAHRYAFCPPHPHRETEGKGKLAQERFVQEERGTAVARTAHLPPQRPAVRGPFRCAPHPRAHRARRSAMGAQARVRLHLPPPSRRRVHPSLRPLAISDDFPQEGQPPPVGLSWAQRTDARLQWHGSNTRIWHAADGRWKEAHRVGLHFLWRRSPEGHGKYAGLSRYSSGHSRRAFETAHS